VKKIQFSARIAAPRPLVWDTLLGPETYRDWTSAFEEGSYYEGSWDEGQKIRFMAPDGKGMVARVAKNRLHEFLSLQHLGFIKDGVEDTESEAVRAWAPAYENYTFRDTGGATELTIDLDVTPDFEGYMLKTWPKALARLKDLCEAPRS
jgi:hypothetical protein